MVATRGDGTILERPRSLRIALAIVVGVLLTGAAWMMAGGEGGDDRRDLPVPGRETRITVEVLNVARVNGLARAVTRRLRRDGIDVVSYGSAGDSILDSTVIVIRRGDSTAALRVRDALGFGRVMVDVEPRLLLDVSVLVGMDAAGGSGRDE